MRATAEEWKGIPLSFFILFLIIFISLTPLGGSALVWSAHGRPAVRNTTRCGDTLATKVEDSGLQRYALSHD